MHEQEQAFYVLALKRVYDLRFVSGEQIAIESNAGNADVDIRAGSSLILPACRHNGHDARCAQGLVDSSLPWSDI